MKRNRVSINRVLDDRYTFGLAQVFHELWFSNNVLNPRKWRMWTWDKPYRFIIYQFIHIWWEDYLWIVTFNTGTVRVSLKYQSQYSYMYTYSSSVIRKELIKIDNTLSTMAHAVWFIYVRKLLCISGRPYNHAYGDYNTVQVIHRHTYTYLENQYYYEITELFSRTKSTNNNLNVLAFHKTMYMMISIVNCYTQTFSDTIQMKLFNANSKYVIRTNVRTYYKVLV